MNLLLGNHRIEPSQADNGSYIIRRRTLDEDGVKETTIILSLLRNAEICTPTVVSGFIKIYSLPTSEYNNTSQFRQYFW